MTSWNDISAAIVSIIQAECPKVRNVYDFSKNLPAGYPAVTVSPSEHTGEFLDTTRNRRSFVFSIMCLQERLKVGEGEAERILRNLVDQIITVFDSANHTTLNNTCIFVRPIPSKWGYFKAPDVDVRVAEVLLEAVTAE